MLMISVSYKVICDWEAQGYVLPDTGTLIGIWIQYNYSRGQEPIPLPVLKGTFF